MSNFQEISASVPSSPSRRPAKQSRVLPLTVSTLAGLVIGFLFLGPVATEPSSADVAATTLQPQPVPEDGTDFVLPSKSLTPEQVVSTQMEALVAYREAPSAIRQVFAFASPANKAVTGPLDRFERMIQGDGYYPMVESDYWMAGRAVAREGQATVLVTTIDANDSVSLYRFYLSKQKAPHEDCWMTDRVIRLIQGRQPATAGSVSDSI